MNYRKMECGKHEIIAIGQENSITDNKAKLEKCFNCYNMPFCEYSSNILKSIIRQQENLRALERITLNKTKGV